MRRSYEQIVPGTRTDGDDLHVIIPTRRKDGRFRIYLWTVLDWISERSFVRLLYYRLKSKEHYNVSCFLFFHDDVAVSVGPCKVVEPIFVGITRKIGFNIGLIVSVEVIRTDSFTLVKFVHVWTNGNC